MPRRGIGWRILTVVAALLVLKVTAVVVMGYVNYLPANFNSDFLRGRESYFYEGYHWAFYLHIAFGPIALILGMILVNEPFRRRFPQWHRLLGRIQVAGVLLLVAPSGLVMAYFAAAGPVAAVGFALLALLTAATITLGWRAAVQRRFADHRRWMWRNFLLLSSAVVLRVLGGLATVLILDAAWFDALAGWASWLVPLAAFELANWRNLRLPQTRPVLR